MFCVIVGEKGSAFGVDIDASESVHDLKDAIAVKRMYESAASKLQLFLGKTKDGTWLDRDGAEAVTFDGNGYPESFMHMDPFLWIKNPKIFGENFEPNEGEIHVLVVVPEVDHGGEREHRKARD
jgi:Crinkler effector protein N-terminal domain